MIWAVQTGKIQTVELIDQRRLPAVLSAVFWSFARQLKLSLRTKGIYQVEEGPGHLSGYQCQEENEAGQDSASKSAS